MPTFENNTFVSKWFSFRINRNNKTTDLNLYCDGVVQETKEIQIGHETIELVHVDFELNSMKEIFRMVCQPYELIGITGKSNELSSPKINSMYEFKFVDSSDNKAFLLWGLFLDDGRIQIEKGFRTDIQSQFGYLVDFALYVDRRLCEIIVNNVTYKVANRQRIEEYITAD